MLALDRAHNWGQVGNGHRGEDPRILPPTTSKGHKKGVKVDFEPSHETIVIDEQETKFLGSTTPQRKEI